MIGSLTVIGGLSVFICLVVIAKPVARAVINFFSSIGVVAQSIEMPQRIQEESHFLS